MADSLHELNTAATFAAWGRTLWNRWNTIGNGGTRVAERQAYVTRCVRGMLRNINVHPCNVTYSVGGDGGSMSRLNWAIDISSPNFANNNILLDKFCEILKTAYHEMRHIEQYHRIVQSLCLGINEWRGKKGDQLTTVSTGADVENRMGINANAATHAIGHRDFYNGFANSVKMDHCMTGSVPNRPNDKWSNTVDEWYLRRYKSDRKEWGDKGLAATWGSLMDVQFYKRGELDIDTVALENRLYDRLKTKWNNFDINKNKGRQNAAFPQP